MYILEDVIDRELKELHKEGVQLRHIGRLEMLAPTLQEKVLDAIDVTKNNDRLILNIAFNYGGRDEIVQAIRQMIQDDVDPAQVDEKLNEYLSARTWYEKTYNGKKPLQAAYFSMEFGLHDSIKLYSGGLGVLAGDYLKEASDSKVDLVGVGLLYRYGYFKQVISAHGGAIHRNEGPRGGSGIGGDQEGDHPRQGFGRHPGRPVGVGHRLAVVGGVDGPRQHRVHPHAARAVFEGEDAGEGDDGRSLRIFAQALPLGGKLVQQFPTMNAPNSGMPTIAAKLSCEHTFAVQESR
jgi:hypothetical protein